MTTETDSLTTDRLHGTIVVRDSEGGIWWPGEELQAEIDEMTDESERRFEVLRTCRREPMRGTWRQ